VSKDFIMEVKGTLQNGHNLPSIIGPFYGQLDAEAFMDGLPIDTAEWNLAPIVSRERVRELSRSAARQPQDSSEGAGK